MTDEKTKNTAVLLISCPDRKGIDTIVTRFVSEHEGNILHFDQHVDLEQNVFFMRIEWDMDGFTVPAEQIASYLKPIALDFKMDWQLHFSGTRQRMAVFVSKMPHCLFDMLARVESGEWEVDIPLVISNHEALRGLVEKFGIEYHYLPVTKDNKAEQEARQLALLREHKVDFVVLARYMQILSPVLLAEYPLRVINIHHSFLPAFPGARPYHSAYARGVKLIGATSHYATEDLDAGPIIEQGTARVSHKDSVQDFIRKGRDLEKVVLARAVWNHLRHRIIAYNNKTVILD
jgi:formyltetrahydrofolate deformylase